MGNTDRATKNLFTVLLVTVVTSNGNLKYGDATNVEVQFSSIPLKSYQSDQRLQVKAIHN